MSDAIRTQVQSILESARVTYSAQYIRQTKRDDWQCDEWRVDIGAEEFEFFTGLGLRTKIEDTAAGRLAASILKGSHRNSLAWEAARKAHCKPQAPHAADVLHSLILDMSAEYQTFEEWCAEFGYDNDSRKAETTFDACRANSRKLRKVFTREQIEALQTALQEY